MAFKDIPALIPRACECDLTWKKGLRICDEAKDLEVVRLSCIIQQTQNNHRDPYKRPQGGSESKGRTT